MEKRERQERPWRTSDREKETTRPDGYRGHHGLRLELGKVVKGTMRQ